MFDIFRNYSSNYMPFLNKLTLKIHCWGGLGSQLLALNYYLRVQEMFPGKRIILVLHTGGITARSSEIDFLSSKINLLKVDDYRASSNSKQLNTSDSKLIFSYIKMYIKFLANYFRFVITDDRKVFKVRFWTYSVRCTYTSNILRDQDIIHMADILGIDSINLEQNFLGVHYRMGDLLTLKPDSLVPFNSIFSVIDKIIKSGAVVDKVKIFSDSILDDSNLRLPEEIDFEWKSVDTLQTIRELSQVKYFVGTNSKVSLWVAIFRLCLVVPGDIYLPINIAKNLSNVLNLEKKNFRTYSNIE
jgi:hypothetical protein